MKSDSDYVIYPTSEISYLISLLYCTDSAIQSATRLHEVLEDNKEDFRNVNPFPPLNEVQNIASQGAAISRCFWPNGKNYVDRGKILRQAFDISDDSPLKNRKLRNMIEHFDEYLDEYLKKCTAGQFVPNYFGPKPNDDRGPLKLFRAYFTNTAEFEIFEENFHLQPIMDEIMKLHEKLEYCMEHGCRFPKN